MSRFIPVHSTPSYPPLSIYWSGVPRSYGLPLFAVVKPRPMATRALRITLVRTSNWSGHFAGLARSGLIPSASRTITAARFSSVVNHAQMATISSGITGGFFRLSCRVPTSGTMGHKFCRRYSVMREFGTEPPNSPLLLTSEEIEADLKKLHISSWWIGEDVAKSKNKSTGQVVEKKVKTLFTRLKFKKYSDGLELVRRVGEVAERVDVCITVSYSIKRFSDENMGILLAPSYDNSYTPHLVYIRIYPRSVCSVN